MVTTECLVCSAKLKFDSGRLTCPNGHGSFGDRLTLHATATAPALRADADAQTAVLERSVAERMDSLTITLTLEEAITVLAALEVAGTDVTRETAKVVSDKIDAAIEDA